MEGHNTLHSLPQDTKNAISEKFGSIGQLYKRVFDLENENYRLHISKLVGKEVRQAEIRNELSEIEMDLDEIGINGDDILLDISNDHGEIILQRKISDLDNYLRKFGTDFETMRKWMKDDYGI